MAENSAMLFKILKQRTVNIDAEGVWRNALASCPLLGIAARIALAVVPVLARRAAAISSSAKPGIVS
jgi:hypothetical protein